MREAFRQYKAQRVFETLSKKRQKVAKKKEAEARRFNFLAGSKKWVLKDTKIGLFKNIALYTINPYDLSYK